MKKVITYGTYDVLHHGHINILRHAKELGDYLIVGVTSDSFDKERGKLNVRNNVLERVEAVRATGYADKIIIEDYVGQKIDDIQKYDVDIFCLGSDWEGKMDYLKEYCEVIYLPRTEGVSSTQIRLESMMNIKVGIIGTGRIANRFIPEVTYVNGVNVCAVYNPIEDKAQQFAEKHQLISYDTELDSFLSKVDAVYIASPHIYHYEQAKNALEAGKHVLCEIPFVLKEEEARKLYALAESKGLVLLEASKTAHCPAWNHLQVMAKSGVIGDIIDVKASLSKLMHDTKTREFDSTQAGGSMTELAPLPLMAIFKLLGIDYQDLSFCTKMQDGVDIYTKGSLIYENAVASFTLGLGVKIEGNIVVSGTKGYILAPSPWWLTSYFEVCFEDQNKNKKYFYSFDGDGLRYEIQEFASMIVNRRLSSYRLRRKESIAIARTIEKFLNKENVKKLK
ncbi:glycerol-3-phosphate cytidyltransferase [Bacteroides intestinalis CAG:315]|nr:glycerol-3-phosphate cytidyltransferase [Bacteroides intestinalis CAG:315]